MKQQTIKNFFKITIGIIIFVTLPSLLFFGAIYFKYNEPLPDGIQGNQADSLAQNMLNTLDYQAYKNTNYIEWTFKKRHHFKWKKNEGRCEVYWKKYHVSLNLKNYTSSKTYVENIETQGEASLTIINQAIKIFNNDSFWLVAPYKVFDKGVQRRLVTLKNNKKALLVTYTSGGTTPGDSYLWLFDDSGRPSSFKIWTSILPIDGLEATWANWVTTGSGLQLATLHKLLFLEIEIENIKTSK